MVCVILFRLDASESLINGYITALPCVDYGLPLPGICDCEEETNGCGEQRRFHTSEAALFDTSFTFSCYVNGSRLVSQPVNFYLCKNHLKHCTANLKPKVLPYRQWYGTIRWRLYSITTNKHFNICTCWSNVDKHVKTILVVLWKLINMLSKNPNNIEK